MGESRTKPIMSLTALMVVKAEYALVSGAAPRVSPKYTAIAMLKTRKAPTSETEWRDPSY